MHKLILLTLLVSGMLPVYAQTSVGVTGGYNLNSVYPVYKTEEQAQGFGISSRSGWHAGLVADQHLWGKFYLQPQLLLNEKGYNYSSTYTYDDPETFSYNKFKRRLLYLELQANLLFKQQIGKGKLFVGAGPYLARGIGGREVVDGYVYTGGEQFNHLDYYVIKYKKKYPPLDPYNTVGAVRYVKPYDAGVNLLAGYELKNGLFFNVIYSLGLKDTGYFSTYKDKNVCLGLSVGYFLKRWS